MNIKYIGEINSERYKNLDLDQGLKLSEGLNIFIGSNGSGKSNFIALLDFFKNSVSGNAFLDSNGASRFIQAISNLGDSRMLNARYLLPEKVNLSFSFVTENTNNKLKLNQSDENTNISTKRKLLTFSDGRQDASFFASHYQRTHTEALYRQTVWQAFQNDKNSDGIASIGGVEQKLYQQFLQNSIPHPDRNSEWHHRSYSHPK